MEMPKNLWLSSVFRGYKMNTSTTNALKKCGKVTAINKSQYDQVDI